MRYKSAPLGVVVSRVQIIELSFSIIVIASVADGIVIREVVVGVAFNSTVAVSIVCIFGYLSAACVKDSQDVTLQVTMVIVGLQSGTVIGIHNTYYTRFIVEIYQVMGMYSCASLVGLGAQLSHKPAAVIVEILGIIGRVRATPCLGKRIEDVHLLGSLSVCVIGEAAELVISHCQPRISSDYTLQLTSGPRVVFAFVVGNVAVRVI